MQLLNFIDIVAFISLTKILWFHINLITFYSARTISLYTRTEDTYLDLDQKIF